MLLEVVVMCGLVRNTFALHQNASSSLPVTRSLEDEDYDWNYDYELTNNISEELEMKSDSFILPNPETIASRYSSDILPEDSLADPDLKDHNFIDNIMYVYYGSHAKIGISYGSEIIIFGSVLSCAAQLLTIFCVLLRKKLSVKQELRQIFLHLVGCMCTSNLMFMLGVYATRNATKCKIFALFLHYLHLLTAFWIFLYCLYISKRPSENFAPKLKTVYLVAYGLPAILTLLSFAVAPKSYETRKFCFVSVQKGMLLNYMLPVSLLIIATTVYSLNGIRKINLELSKLEMTSSAESLNMLRTDFEDEKKPDEEVIGLKESKCTLKLTCVVQTAFDVVWFMAVLALENMDYSNVMPVFYTIFYSSLNWYIFAKTKTFLPSTVSLTNQLPIDCAPVELKTITDPLSVSRRSSCDNIPLLVNSEGCTEMHELRQDTISTISN